jgi:hypothetical protein
VEGETIELGLQLAVAAVLVILMTIVHAFGIVGISRVLDLKEDRLKQLHFDIRGVVLMCGMVLSLFALHIFEIWIFAAFYLLVDALGTLEGALYYSASAYATLGQTTDDFPERWRLITGVEALIGFVLIGWSTAFIVTRFEKLRE